MLKQKQLVSFNKIKNHRRLLTAYIEELFIYLCNLKLQQRHVYKSILSMYFPYSAAYWNTNISLISSFVLSWNRFKFHFVRKKKLQCENAVLQHPTH